MWLFPPIEKQTSVSSSTQKQPSLISYLPYTRPFRHAVPLSAFITILKMQPITSQLYIELYVFIWYYIFIIFYCKTLCFVRRDWVFCGVNQLGSTKFGWERKDFHVSVCVYQQQTDRGWRRSFLFMFGTLFLHRECFWAILKCPRNRAVICGKLLPLVFVTVKWFWSFSFTVGRYSP